MTALTIKNCDKKILVVGPLYDKIEKLSSKQSLFDEHELIIFNGNLTFPNGNLQEVENRIKIMEEKLQPDKFIYNLADQDLILMLDLHENRKSSFILDWLKTKSNVVIINFINQSNLIITGGGLSPNMLRSDLYNNLEITFVSVINASSWHELYGGAYGYVISNNPLTKEFPKFYNFSLQLGNKYDQNNEAYAVSIGKNGIDRIFAI